MKQNIELSELWKLYFELYENKHEMKQWSIFHRINLEVFGKDNVEREIEKNPEILSRIGNQIIKVETVKLSKRDRESFYDVKESIEEQKLLIEEFIKEWEASKK